MTEKKKTVEECRAAYVEAKREYALLCARFEELKSAVNESDAVGRAASELRHELCRLEHTLKEALFQQAIASAPPIPVEATIPVDSEALTEILACDETRARSDYWK